MGMNFNYLEISSQEYNFRVISRYIFSLKIFIFLSYLLYMCMASCMEVHVCGYGLQHVCTDVCACVLVETKDQPLVSPFRCDPPCFETRSLRNLSFLIQLSWLASEPQDSCSPPFRCCHLPWIFMMASGF